MKVHRSCFDAKGHHMQNANVVLRLTKFDRLSQFTYKYFNAIKLSSH